MRLAWSLLWLAGALFSAYAFHERYWRWRACFNELGRCYDPEAGVMVEQAGLIWGGLLLIFGLLLVRSLRRLLRERSTP